MAQHSLTLSAGQVMSDSKLTVTVRLDRIARARIVLGGWLLKQAARVMGCGLTIRFERAR